MKKPTFKSIRTRLMFWFFFIGIVLLVAALTIAYIQRAKAIREGAFSKLGAIRDLKVGRLNEWIDERLGDVAVISGDDEIRVLTEIIEHKSKSPEELKRIKVARNLLKRYLRHYDAYNEMSIIDANTGLVGLSTNRSLEGENKSHDASFIAPLKTGKIFIKDIYYSSTTGRPGMSISVPIVSLAESKRIVGVLVAQLDLDSSLYSLLLEKAGLGETGETLIVNEDTIALSELHWHKDAPMKLRIKALPAIKSAQGKTGIEITKDYRGKEVAAAYTYMPKTGWGFVSKQDIYELNAPVREMILNFSILFILAALLTYFISLLASRTISKPIRVLARGTEELGRGNLDYKVGTDEKDEIGMLSRAFDEMSGKLKKNEDELKNEITERTKAEEEVRRFAAKLQVSNKELEAFSYSVSHDLRAPLRSMDGFSRILLDTCKDKLDDDSKDNLIRVRKASQRMAQLIEDLLTLSRVTRQDIKKERCNLSQIAEVVLSDLRESTPQRQKVKVVTPKGLFAEGDSHLMRLVLENLLGNAWKFTSKTEKPSIEFGKVPAEKENVFFVRDNGAGFDMKYVDKLFGAFQRLHTEKEFPGTGIGLVSVKRIISRHGGRVWAEGEVGKGATFYFALP